MSKLSEYSKFDHLDESSSSEDENETNTQQHSHSKDGRATASAMMNPTTGTTTATSNGDTNVQPVSLTKKGSENGRFIFEHNGCKIYEWEQNLEEVNVYIDVPPNIKSASEIKCNIKPNHLQLGLINHDRYFIDESTFSKVKTSDSSWYYDKEAKVIHVILSKVYKGETWEGVLLGRDKKEIVDPYTKSMIQKEMMIERFQEENPGFDFRGAEFNGSIPDPQTYMGGVKYT